MKKLISALAALVLGASLLTVPAFAASDDIQTHAALCPDCNYGELIIVNETYTPWTIIDSYNCPNTPGKVDFLRERTHYTFWQCTSCGAGDVSSKTHHENYCPH